jgi:hypothetical protein
MFTENHKLIVIHFVLVLILILGMLGFEPVKPVFASTLTVTNTNDSGAGSLRKAIADATSGDIITFNPSVSGQSIVLSTTLVINKNLTIDASALASQITVSGNDLYRVFYINSGVIVTLDSLIVAHGKSPYGDMGGGIFSAGTLTVTNSTISENSAAYGGGIFNEGGAVTLIDSTLSDNDAYMEGAGVYSQGGTVTVSNSILSNNMASYTGGGIYNAGGTVAVENSTFSDNSGDPLMSSYAGGIYNAGGTLTISDSIFSNNSAHDSGGGIFHGSGTLTITNSIFSGNNARVGGGIISAATLIVDNNVFFGNSAERGGGIYNNGSQGMLTVTDSTFSDNSAQDGGGIFNYDMLTVTNSTFTGNGTIDYDSVGGAISNYASATVTNSTFFENFAYTGGGLHNWDTLTVTNSTLYGNEAGWGGGIANSGYVVGGTLTVTNSTFSANGALHGGGIANMLISYQNNSTLNSVNTIIANSFSGGDCYNAGDIGTNINNLVEDGSCSASMSGDPNLVLLADNGGPTPTMALHSNSPALDAGNDISCPATDQRGVTRPQGGHCDIGAFEAEYTLVDVNIGNVDRGSYPLVLHGSRRQSLSGINSGPVKITHEVNDPMTAAERVIYRVNGVNTSFTEMMGLPANQLDNTYWLPWYNNVDLDTQLRIANATNNAATVTVTIGGVAMPTLNLAAGESTRVSYAGVNNGPVKIASNQNIVAAERVIYKVQGVQTSFSEMMALPASQLDNTYWLPWYNNVDLDTQLRIANTTNNIATVHIFIGGNEVTPVSGLTLLAGESTRVSYPGVNNGPVKIVSDQNIVAAERVIYKVQGVQTSFTEMMALPQSQLDTTYWLPWYNNVDLDTQLRFGNVSNATATVHIFIGGNEVTPVSGITLLAGESTRLSYPGVNDGPVQIVSNQNIVAAERVIYKVNGKNTSFSEMMALPNALLETTYWFPWYNNVDLDTQLRFGVP